MAFPVRFLRTFSVIGALALATVSSQAREPGSTTLWAHPTTLLLSAIPLGDLHYMRLQVDVEQSIRPDLALIASPSFYRSTAEDTENDLDMGKAGLDLGVRWYFSRRRPEGFYLQGLVGWAHHWRSDDYPYATTILRDPASGAEHEVVDERRWYDASWNRFETNAYWGWRKPVGPVSLDLNFGVGYHLGGSTEPVVQNWAKRDGTRGVRTYEADISPLPITIDANIGIGWGF